MLRHDEGMNELKRKGVRTDLIDSQAGQDISFSVEAEVYKKKVEMIKLIIFLILCFFLLQENTLPDNNQRGANKDEPSYQPSHDIFPNFGIQYYDVKAKHDARELTCDFHILVYSVQKVKEKHKS